MQTVENSWKVTNSHIQNIRLDVEEIEGVGAEYIEYHYEEVYEGQ